MKDLKKMSNAELLKMLNTIEDKHTNIKKAVIEKLDELDFEESQYTEVMKEYSSRKISY